MIFELFSAPLKESVSGNSLIDKLETLETVLVDNSSLNSGVSPIISVVISFTNKFRFQR